VFRGKKRYAGQKKREELQPIDFAWLKVVALQIGFTFQEYGALYFGELRDMMEEWKKIENRRTQRQIYSISEEPPVDDIDEL
jgi:hypothetical protein